MLVPLILFCLSAARAKDCGSHADGEMYPKTDGACLPSYYWCVNGVETEYLCGSGLVFDDEKGYCNYPSEVDSCSTVVVNKNCTDGEGNSIDGLSFTKSDNCAEGFYYKCENGSPVEYQCKDGHIFDSSIQMCVTEASGLDCAIISVTEGTTTVAQTSPEDSTSAGDTYIGFVVDHTGSMAVEIEAVTSWIKECVETGFDSSCGSSPSGGWAIISFNDPSTSAVVGPTLDTDEIIETIQTYWAYGGGDCPEVAFTGLERLADAIPDGNAECKIYLFTDAIAKDSQKYASVTQLFNDKGCSLDPIITGCCGDCPPACDSVSPQYCIDHVTDFATSTRSMSTYSDVATLFYAMSEQTRGNIYVTGKPSSREEMLKFLQTEVTLGF